MQIIKMKNMKQINNYKHSNQSFPKAKQKIIKYECLNSWHDGIPAVFGASTLKSVDLRVYLPSQVTQ